jgi:AcrR family transcriptional regulator
MRVRIRKPAAERRTEIALAVLRIIGERGLTSLTTATLAEEVGVTSGALFRHFASLDEILLETVRHGVRRMDETFPDASLRPRERLMKLARNRVQLLRSDPGLAWLLRSEQAYLTLPDEAVKSLRALGRRSREYLVNVIREGMSEGSIRDDIEPQVLLVPVMGTIHALAGMTGVHHLAPGTDTRQQEAVLSALERMIAPSDGSSRGRRRTTKRGLY